MVLMGLVVVWCILKAVQAGYYPAECPQHCQCDGPTAKCEGGTIPSLDHRITVFEIEDINTPITDLTADITEQLKNLVTLRLNSIGLRWLEASALALIEHLRDLSIKNNNITTLDRDIFLNCSKLTSLNLENNNIQIIDNQTFEPLEELHYLNLAHNALTVLPHMPEKLQTLNIEHNQIITIKHLSLSHLQSLNLCHNSILHIEPDQISMKELKALCLGGADFILSDSLVSPKNFPTLENLTLMGTQQSRLSIENGAQNNIQTMAKTMLHTLHLESCRLRNAVLFNLANSNLMDLKAIDTILIQSTRVQKYKLKLPSIAVLDLSGSPFLANLFLNSRPSATMPHLRVLRMSRCSITTFNENFFQQKVPNITDLDLSHNPLVCTCYGMTWIPDYVREGKLILLQELNTTCTKPAHLNTIPLLTASMCPITSAPHINTSPSTTSESPLVTVHLCSTEQSLDTHHTSNESPKDINQCKYPSVTTNRPGVPEKTAGRGNVSVIAVSVTGAVVVTVLLVLLLWFSWHWCHQQRHPGQANMYNLADHESAVFMNKSSEQMTISDTHTDGNE